MEMTAAVKTRNDKVLGESSGHVNGEQRLNQAKKEEINLPC